jgi:hypothetical protein
MIWTTGELRRSAFRPGAKKTIRPDKYIASGRIGISAHLSV